MRPPYRYLLFLFLGPVAAAAVCVSAPAATADRSLYFVNAGSETIYAIRIGHRATGVWSDDLLAMTEVVDIGDSRRVRVSLQDTCWYDVRFEYSDGHSGELDNVDLCSASRIFLKD